MDENTPPLETELLEEAPQPGWIDEMREAVAHAVVGMHEELRATLIAALAEGHCLLEGPPGVAKTLLVRSIAAALGGEYSRIQFTPDLMPSDVTGTGIYRPDKGQFEFKPGPIFANVLLCDEINRAPAKTQAALLEAMQEGAVTIDGERHELPKPFLVFATQNPIEHEGTYPLPEAQLDRFLFKVLIGYPDEEVEARLLHDVHARNATASPSELGVTAVCSPGQLSELAAEARKIEVRADLPAYVVKLLTATRTHAALQMGASPRAGVMLLRAAKTLALAEGRDYVLPDDIKRVFLPALRHRVLLEPAEEVEGGTTDAVLRSILDSIEVPR
jgi:MoxR-like ATPase